MRGVPAMDFQGFPRPVAFAPPGEELRRAREARAVFDLNGMTLLEVAGTDACDYLQRRLTQAIRTMAVGGNVYAAMLGGDGRMIADMFVRRDGESRFLLMAQPCVRDTLASQVERYVIADDVTVTDVSSDRRVFAMVGPGAETFPGEHPPTQVACMLGSSVALYVCPAPGADSFWAGLSRFAEAGGGGPCGHACWEALRMAGCVPLFGADMTSSTIPLEAGLLHAISFDKGCYPGQEVVARIHNLGHPANVLVALETENGPPPVGAVISSGDKVLGQVTSRMSPGFPVKPDALGMVKWDQRKPGTSLRISGDGYEGDATVTAMAGSVATG